MSNGLKCPRCGTGLEPAARFCGVCGEKLAAFDPDATSLEKRAPASAPGAPARPAKRPAQIVSTIPPGIPPGDDPYAGKTLNNRFVIESKLGEGGFGAVYRGTQLGTHRRVAVKLLHPEMGRDPNVVARFRREGEVLCSLRDAHSITTYDFDQTADGTLFIAMELLEGKSLHELFQTEAPIAWQRMLKIMSEMCSSLEEAHALGIVHRDLKPENVYLENRPGNPEFVKVLDFGIAKVVRGDGHNDRAPQLTATGQTLGTLEYMSPEQLMGKELDGRSDVYALGVLAFEMMTGRLPFPDAVGPAMLISAQLKKTPPLASATHPEGGIPPGVDALIARALEKTKERRFADAGELRREIDRLLVSGGRLDAGPASAAVAPLARPTPLPVAAPGAVTIRTGPVIAAPLAGEPAFARARPERSTPPTGRPAGVDPVSTQEALQAATGPGRGVAIAVAVALVVAALIAGGLLLR